MNILFLSIWQFVFIVLSALLLFTTPVPAVPAGSGIAPPLLDPVQFLFQSQDSRRPWIRLRDSIIEKIWGIPKKPLGIYLWKDPYHRNFMPSKALARYDSDVVLRFKLRDSGEAKALADAIDNLFLDVWASTDEFVDIRLAREVIPSLLGLLPQSLQSAHTLLIEDLANMIHDSYPSPPLTSFGSIPSLSSSESQSSHVEDIFFHDYRPLAVITLWMRSMATLFPSHVQTIKVGESSEGRDIPAFRLGIHPTNSEPRIEDRKAVVIIGGAHAREWIGTSTVTYIAHKLIVGYGKSAAITRLLEEFDWILVPTINPDGYIYTWESDRLWRKTRQQTSLSVCPGIDLDRAWDFEWDGESTRYNPCSESYAGNEPFEAVEARMFAEWTWNETKKNNINIVGFLDFHSYSQQILYPYAFSCLSTPPTLENLQELAIGIAKAIRLTHHKNYDVVSACEAVTAAKGGNDGTNIPLQLENTGGSVLDWFYNRLHATYSYQIKLRDQGTYGFLLPPENIVPTGEEIFSAVLVFGKFLFSRHANAVDVDLDGEFKNLEKRDNSESRIPFSTSYDTALNFKQQPIPDSDIDHQDAFSTLHSDADDAENYDWKFN